VCATAVRGSLRGFSVLLVLSVLSVLLMLRVLRML
jgi:hypothetical protein